MVNYVVVLLIWASCIVCWCFGYQYGKGREQKRQLDFLWLRFSAEKKLVRTTTMVLAFLFLSTPAFAEDRNNEKGDTFLTTLEESMGSTWLVDINHFSYLNSCIYHYEPKPDITVEELSQLLPMLVNKPYDPGYMYDALPDGAKRHIRKENCPEKKGKE